jgi:hypothetical protein
MNNLSLLYSLIRKLVSQASGVIQEYFPFQVLSSKNTLNLCIAVKPKYAACHANYVCLINNANFSLTVGPVTCPVSCNL